MWRTLPSGEKRKRAVLHFTAANNWKFRVQKHEVTWHIFLEQSNRLWGQQDITYTRAGQLWFCWWSVLSRASQGSWMVHANNNYLSEAVNCPENEYEPLQHRNEELQFLLNHFSTSWKRIAMIDAMQWKNRSFWSSMHINKFQNCYPSIFIMI